MLTETMILLNKSRKELLDLTLRNTLINYGKKRKQIEIVDEKSDSIFEIMVKKGRGMSFEPLEEAKTEELLNDGEADITQLLSQPDEILDDKGYANRHYDNKLQTKLSPDKLQRMLLSIHNDSKTYIEEQGVNILYLALGFLHWFESDSAAEPKRAPLVLIPVSLGRKSAKERFSLSYNGSEIGENLSLCEKLKAEFAIELPVIEDIEDFDVLSYFESISQSVAKEKRWFVEPHEITLGFFSFGKFLMYKDLDSENWKGYECNVLDAVLNDGFKFDSVGLPEDTYIDEIVSPHNSCLIKDADSSQILAVLDAKSGKNLVIQGPPGTGKSQTITNIIAEGLSEGKKILFVAEKMAALEVVKSRLDKSGLGDAVFELHSFKTNKKHVLEELNRVLEAGRPKDISNSYDIDEYLESRKRLNDYCKAVNSVIDGTKLTFVHALGKRNAINNPIIEGDSFPNINLDQEQYQRARLIIQEITTFLKDNGSPYANPLAESGLCVCTPSDKADITREIKSILTDIDHVIENTRYVGELINREFDTDKATITKLMITAEKAVGAPDLYNADLNINDWLMKREEIVSFMCAADELQKSYAKYRDKIIDEAWTQDLLQERKIFAAVGDKWWRFLSGDYRKASNNIKGYVKGSLDKDNKAIVEMLDTIMSFQKQKPSVEELIGKIEKLFNDSMDLMKTQWTSLKVTSDWLYERHREILREEILGCVFELVKLSDQHENVVSKCRLSVELFENIDLLYKDIAKKVMIPEKAYKNLNDLRMILNDWLNNIDYLDSITYFNALNKKLIATNLDKVGKKAFDWKYAPEAFINAYDYKWYDELVERAFKSKPEIYNFNVSGHKTKIGNFVEIDKKLMIQNCCKLALNHYMGIPRGFDGEMKTIRQEINKKRNIMPIRKLIGYAGRAIQSIKPVFMMSPMSIATYLPAGSVKFDMVVFDEASQVKPVDAFGAILRGKQTIVVGDKKQLPPTSFFDKISAENEDEDDSQSVGDMESILSLFESRGAFSRMLRWHYRSRHDSLIAVSNSKFYDNKLVIFPSPTTAIDEAGLSIRYCPETVYDKGKTKTNPKEAEIVAKEIMQHAKSRPHKSLGVVAFSMSQRDEIEAKLELLRKQDDSCEDFFARDLAEPFFIKNLENVQGDERDLIFISIGYGKSADGVLSANFGPLTKLGGERRLNVLISRAKHKMIVFSNFRASEMDLRNSQSMGTHSLKYFLEFAETKRLEQPFSTGMETDSPFEDAVIKALNDRGVETEPQVGTAGFRIDIGVKHPEFPGKYLLGIECDGAAYHSARSARDRDRLRQEVLEGLGWRIHRIWSTDWYRSPDKELEKALDAIKVAAERQFDDDEKAQASAVSESIIERESAPMVESIGSLQYEKAEIDMMVFFGRDFYTLTARELIPYIEKIVHVESPIHIDELTKRLRLAMGVQKSGSRIQKLVSDVCKDAHRVGIIKFQNEFVWDPAMSTPKVRDRSHFDNQEKKIEYICDEEILEAIKNIVDQSFTIHETDLLVRTANMLGFARTTDNIAHRIRVCSRSLISSGTYTIEDSVVKSLSV